MTTVFIYYQLERLIDLLVYVAIFRKSLLLIMNIYSNFGPNILKNTLKIILKDSNE
jgi:hypothetical protein